MKKHGWQSGPAAAASSRNLAYWQLILDLEALDPDLAEQACFEAGAMAVTLTDSRDDAVLEPAPGEVRLWPATRISALFDDALAPETIRARLSESLGTAAAGAQLEKVADRAWEREWLKDFHPMRFGRRLWVAPHHADVSSAEAVIVRLDPGLAFGTGTHPTTALCLEWLDASFETGGTVIDYGCGSGILALAAARLGAARVDCFDIDPQALLATADNAQRNGLAGCIHLHGDADQLPHGAALLIANILAGPLCALAPRFATLVRPGGRIVLAGILEDQERDVTAAYRAWFDVVLSGEREGWVLLSGTRSSACSPSVPNAV